MWIGPIQQSAEHIQSKENLLMAAADLREGSVKMKKNWTLNPLPAVPHEVSTQNLTGCIPSYLRGKNRVVDASHKFLLLLKAERYFTLVIFAEIMWDDLWAGCDLSRASFLTRTNFTALVKWSWSLAINHILVYSHDQKSDILLLLRRFLWL